MNREELAVYLQSDEQSYYSKPCSGLSDWMKRQMNPGLIISKAYRKCKYFSSHKYLKVIGLLCRIWYHHLCIKYGYDVPSNVIIGKAFRIFHPYGIVINSGTKIGNNFTISGGVKIGIKESGKYPVIGDNVTIGINSTIIGAVHIGNNAMIGAGAVVVKDVPENAIVGGNPARVIKMRG